MVAIIVKNPLLYGKGCSQLMEATMHQYEKVYRTDLTPISFLRRSAVIFPNKIAVVHGDRRYS
jgi:hypothetical protein